MLGEQSLLVTARGREVGVYGTVHDNEASTDHHRVDHGTSLSLNDRIQARRDKASLSHKHFT